MVIVKSRPRRFHVAMRFDSKLDALIHHRGLSQTELARRTGIPQQTISNLATWNNKEKKPKQRPYLEQALKLARVLNVSLDYLADPERNEFPPAEITEREKQVMELVRRMGAEAAYWRLVLDPSSIPSEPPPRSSGTGDVKPDASRHTG